MNEDTPLIERTLQGDQAAFGQLVCAYQDRLYHCLVQTTRSPEEAEDIAQETFVQAYLKLATFQGHSAFYTWLYRIAFNLAASRHRRKRETVSLEAMREQGGLDAVDPEESASEQLLRRERSDLLHAALARLEEDHRTILALREMDGLDYEAIADILDLPTGTVRSRIHRARTQLREILRTMLEDSAAH